MSFRTFVIAEAGVNHNGSLKRAIKMVDVAACAGADAIKFQTFKAEEVIARNAPKAEYQKSTTGFGRSQLEMVQKLELDEKAHKMLIRYCEKKKVIFLSAPFDLGSIDLLSELGVEMFKIPSGEITNLPYLRKIGSLGKRLVMSTGMSDLGEIEDALGILTESGTPIENITVLHCNTEYPTPFEDVNLKAMLTIGHAFGVSIGYSDHTVGIEIPIAAVALGASVIEKHFTLDKNLQGPDHRASLEPKELADMINCIRHIETAMGNGIKIPSPSEMKNLTIARKSLVAAIPIEAGEILNEKNLTVKRPGTGISPMLWDSIIGTQATRSYRKDEQIES